MKRENISIRLKQIMSERNLRQADILHLMEPFCAEHGIKMNKSDISQYLSGKAEPGSEKLALLSMALNVSAAWLVGFDVAMVDSYPIKIVQYYNQLNDIGKHEAEKRVEELSYVPQYAWDPDFTKLTPEERSRLEKAENGEYVDSENIDWNNIEEVEPDEIDLQMLKAIENDPECHEFISQEELIKELYG